MKDITLAQFLNDDRIKCDTVLCSQNWKRLLESDKRIYDTLEEYKNSSSIKVSIYSCSHGDSNIRTPGDKGYTNYYYCGIRKMYITYEINIQRNLCIHEKRKYGRATGIGCSFDLPLSNWITVLRADIQARIKYENDNTCSCCKK